MQRLRACAATTTVVAPLSTTAYNGMLPDLLFSPNGTLQFNGSQSGTRVTAPVSSRPIVILPGFGNETSDYEAPFGQAEGSLANNLRARGFSVHVVSLERKNWFGVARGLLTMRYWRGQLTTNPGYTWYLDRVHATVQKALRETGSSQVDLVGHSAGGWLGRAYLGDAHYQLPNDPGVSRVLTTASPSLPHLTLAIPSSRGGVVLPRPPPGTASPQPNASVGALITLGTPQRPPPTSDRTGGAQGWVHAMYPGAHFASHGVPYVNVGGMTVKGMREMGPNGKPVQIKDRKRLPSEYAYDSYGEVCGEGQGVLGDAVVPLKSAFLEGGRHVLLPGVWHSMSQIGTFDTASGVVWFGSETVVDSWLSEYVTAAY